MAWFGRKAKPVDQAPQYAPKRQSLDLFKVPYRTGATIESSLDAYAAVGTLFAVVSRLANSTAAVDWTLYRKSTDGRRVYEAIESRRSVTRHPALVLLNKPNQYMNRQEFFETVQMSVDLTGEGWIYVERSEIGNVPINLWPLRSDKMTVVKSASNFLEGYIYTTPDNEKMPIAKEDMIFIRMPDPRDIYRGLGPVQALMVDIEASKLSSQYTRNFFLNSAEPGGIISVPESLEDEDFAEFQARWRDQHQGAGNAHRVAILENGATFTPRQYTMRDMQFTELRNMSRDIIMEAFAFPKFMLGLVDDVNKANAIASKAMYNEECVSPRLERIKNALNSDFLALFPDGNDLEFDFELPQLHDPDSDASALLLRSQAAVALVTAGYDPEQALMATGLPPMDFSKPKAPTAPPAPAQGSEPDGDETDSNAGDEVNQ